MPFRMRFRRGGSAAPAVKPAHKDESRDFLARMQWLGALGGLLILVYAFHFWPAGPMARILGVALLVAGAALLAGFLLGFIFAIPRVGDGKRQGSGGDAGAESSQGALKNSLPFNANLVEISDWLTKIIVGVGLVELRSLPPLLGKLSYYLAPALQSTHCPGDTACTDPQLIGQAAGLAIILFYTTLGFLLGYVWTMIYFQRDLSTQVEDLRQQNDTLVAYRLILKAEASLKENRLEEAEHLIDQALEKDPGEGGAVLTKARIFKRRAADAASPERENLLRRALDLTNDAILLLPGKAEPLYNKACYQALLGVAPADVAANLLQSFRLNPALRQIANDDPDLLEFQKTADYKSLIEKFDASGA